MYISPKMMYKANEHINELISTSISHWEMEVKATVRYHFTPTGKAIIKNLMVASVDKDMEKRESCALLVRM